MIETGDIIFWYLIAGLIIASGCMAYAIKENRSQGAVFNLGCTVFFIWPIFVLVIFFIFIFNLIEEYGRRRD